MNMRRNKYIKSFQLQAFGALIVLLVLLITCSTTLAETVETDPFVERITGITSTDVPKPDETFVTESYVHQRWLPFIQNKRATRKEIITNLGEPTEYYEKGRILAYRLLLVEGDRKIIADYYNKRILMDVWQSEANKRRKVLSEKGNLFVFRENMKEERPLENIKFKGQFGWFYRDKGLFSENIKEERFLELVAREAEYSLVLVFDDNNILSKHSLLRVRP